MDNLIQLFLAHVEANNAPDTLKWYLNFLSSFKKAVGTTLTVRDVQLHHVQNWLTKHYPLKGNQNTRHNAIAAVKRLFNWAIRDMGYFDRNPLAGLKKPQRTHRDTCPTRAQWDEVLAHYGPDDPLHDFLSVMIDTGCRPQEMRVVEARHLDFEARVIRFADGEIPGGKMGRDVLLPQAAVGVLQRLALKYPEGPLFRNTDGNPWTKDALNCRFQRLKRAKFPFRVSCYAARHSKATDLLENGASVGAVASILGHRDPTVVLKVYGKHIEQRAEHLRGLVEGAAGKKPSKAPRLRKLTAKDIRKPTGGKRKKDAG